MRRDRPNLFIPDHMLARAAAAFWEHKARSPDSYRRGNDERRERVRIAKQRLYALLEAQWKWKTAGWRG